LPQISNWQAVAEHYVLQNTASLKMLPLANLNLNKIIWLSSKIKIKEEFHYIDATMAWVFPVLIHY
jgi:hypothetical protein